MSLKDQRIKFTRLLCQLITWGNAQPGYQLALGVDGLKHMDGSLHYSGLANDLALYIDGVYQTSTEAYRPLGEYWKKLDPDCRFGGDFKKPDGNHFSLTWGGKA